MPRISREERALIAKTALRVLDNWRVGDGQQRRLLGGLNEAVHASWRAGTVRSVSRDALQRSLLLISIHRGLRSMFTDKARGYAWMSRSNTIFDDATPLDFIANGDLGALIRLRDYLAAQAQLW